MESIIHLSKRKFIMQWYALMTNPRAEKKVASLLEQHQIIHYLPLHKCPRKWSDRIKIVEMPLFPSYIFVKVEAKNLSPLLFLKGVLRVVYYCGKPATIRETEIKAIESFLAKAEKKPICIGDEVLITHGILTNQKGRIQTIKNKTLVLELEQLGMRVSVRLGEVVVG